MREKITIKNEFHDTEITLIAKGGHLSKGQAKRAWKHLCGHKDCTCSGSLGARGVQDYLIFDNFDGTYDVALKK